MAEKKRNFIEKEVKGATIIGVSSPDRLMAIAKERGINPQEVYVRLIYKAEGEECTASQQLRILGKENYEKLKDLVGKPDTVDLTLNLSINEKTGEYSAFFYVNGNVTIEDLFANPVESEVKRNAAPVSILNSIKKKKD
jgi:hypothetical protein